jgi:hypothetical protein
MSGFRRIVWFTFALLVWMCPDALAQKVDVLRLENGDRITCEIKGLSRGVMSVSTDPLGSVAVHWGQIAAIESPRAFNVQLASGQQYYGSLMAGAPPNHVSVDLGNGTSVPLPMSEIVSVVPIGSGFWRRMDGTLDVGFSFAQANLETRAILNGSASYRGIKRYLSLTASSQVTTREDVDREYRADVAVVAGRYLSRRWYLVGWGAFQQNDELSLDLRLVGGAGAGREFVHTNRRVWSLYAGLAATHELYVDTPADESTEAAVGGAFDFFAPDNDDFTFTNHVVTYVNVTGRQRLRFDLQSAWRQEFLSDFYWSLNGFQNYDSDPPDDQKNTDSGVSFTIGWKF